MAITPAAGVLEHMTRKVKVLGSGKLGMLGKRIQNYASKHVVKDGNTDVIKWDIFENGPVNLYTREGATAWGVNVNVDPNLMTIRLARNWFPLIFTGLEMQRGVLIGNERMVGSIVKMAQDEALFQIRRQMMGDSRGILATVPTGSGAGVTTIVLDSVRWVKQGMYIDFYTAAGVVVTAGAGLLVTLVNKTTKAITWSGGSPTLTALDEVYVAGNRNIEVFGLKAWVNDAAAAPGTKGTTVIGGQTRAATRPTLNAYMDRNGGVPRPLSFEMMDKLVATAYAAEPGCNFSAIYGGSGTIAMYKRLLEAKRGIQTQTGKMTYEYGGNEYPAFIHELLSPNKIPLISEPYEDEGILYFVSEKDIGWHGDVKFSWITGGNLVDGKFMPMGNINNTDTFKATMKIEYAITSNPGVHAAIADLTVAYYATS